MLIRMTLVEGKAANALARLFDEINVMIGGQKNNYYYTYGWSGLLSSKTRYKDAEFFFIALENELERYTCSRYIPSRYVSLAIAMEATFASTWNASVETNIQIQQ